MLKVEIPLQRRVPSSSVNPIEAKVTINMQLTHIMCSCLLDSLSDKRTILIRSPFHGGFPLGLEVKWTDISFRQLKTSLRALCFLFQTGCHSSFFVVVKNHCSPIP